MHSRRRLKQEVLEGTPEPRAEEREGVVRVLALRGSNVCEILRPDGSTTLAQIPTRFRKQVWVKRGNFLIVREPPHLGEQHKVRAMVEHILFAPQVKHLKERGLWPEEFTENFDAEVGSSRESAPPPGAGSGGEQGSVGEVENDEDDAELFEAGGAKRKPSGKEEADADLRRSQNNSDSRRNTGNGIVMPSEQEDFGDNPNRRKHMYEWETSSSDDSSSDEDSSSSSS